MCYSSYKPCRVIEVYWSLQPLQLYGTSFNQCSNEGNDPVTAHRAVAFVVQEEYPKVGVGGHRRGQHAAIHIVVAARLPHQRPPHMGGGLAHETPPPPERGGRQV